VRKRTDKRSPVQLINNPIKEEGLTMASQSVRPGPKNPGGSARGSTKPDASGQVLPVTNPLDLWYLCEKARYASANPYRRANDEAPMYQRTVALMIRADNELFEYRWPYCAEVGYDMTRTPPAPIMSKRQPHRPSSFPLSQYKRWEARRNTASPIWPV